MLPKSVFSVLFLFSFISLSFQLKKVLVQNAPPMTVCTPGTTGSSGFGGIEVQIFNEISSSFNIGNDWEFECVESENMIYDKLQANSSVYIAGLGTLRVSINRQLQGFKFSDALLHTGLTLVVSSQDSDWLFVRIFPVSTFSALIAVALTLAVLCYFLERKAFPFDYYLWNAFSSMFFVTTVKLSGTPARILMIAYWFIILIFVSAYAANLTAVMTMGQNSQEIEKVDDLDQKVIKTYPNYMTSLPLYGARPLKITEDVSAATVWQCLADGTVDGYAFEDSLAQILERKDCRLSKRVRLFHPFSYVVVFSNQISSDIIDKVNLALIESIENHPSLTRIQEYIEKDMKLPYDCVRLSPEDENKMSIKDIIHLGYILAGALVLSFFVHFASKTKIYKKMQAFLVSKNLASYIDDSETASRKVGDDLIIDNLKHVTKNSMENLSGTINERLDQMDEKVTKFYELLLHTQANSEMVNPYDLSRDQFGFDGDGNFSEESMEKSNKDNRMNRGEIPLDEFTPMQSPNQSLLRGEMSEMENFERISFKGR